MGITYLDYYYPGRKECKFPWKWFFQSLINRNVYLYYDCIKRYWVRQVDYVQGSINIERVNHYCYCNSDRKTHAFQDRAGMKAVCEFYKYVVFVPAPEQIVNHKLIIEGENTDACHDIEYIFGPTFGYKKLSEKYKLRPINH